MAHLPRGFDQNLTALTETSQAANASPMTGYGAKQPLVVAKRAMGSFLNWGRLAQKVNISDDRFLSKKSEPRRAMSADVPSNEDWRILPINLESHTALRFAIEIEGARTVLMVIVLVDA